MILRAPGRICEFRLYVRSSTEVGVRDATLCKVAELSDWPRLGYIILTMPGQTYKNLLYHNAGVHFL